VSARRGAAALLVLTALLSAPGSAAPVLSPGHGGTAILPRAALASRHFGNDAPWYESNIPFFACSDPEIEQIFYYRWKLYKSHLKDLGARGYIVTEFLDDVSWSLKPYESLNDATGFHILEGRWLADSRYVDEYVDFMYQGGNDRHFSEAIADAAYEHFLVHGRRAAALKNLEAMKRIYRQWDDHYDRAKELYFIEPLLDATEYTISSIDAAGGKEGFRGGDAFRPSINSFMFANARAISRLSTLSGDSRSAQEYAARADALRGQVQNSLWNAEFRHFTDRYKVSSAFVHYGDFIRGRELAGYTPWYFGLPDKDAKYVAAWAHLLSPERFGGPYGLRTVEPGYEYYMKQYRYVTEDGTRKPECQWNGPSWPFQTTLALGGLANLLHDYPRQTVIGAGDYLSLLRQYTKQHFRNGRPDLQENYDPDSGNVIVGLQRSHHYNHSGFNDLIITGLAGLRPREDAVLEVDPLVAASGPGRKPITYFCLENILYHGRRITIVYDRDGKQYHRGAGLSLYVDGKEVLKPSPPGKKMVRLSGGAPVAPPSPPPAANLLVNLSRSGFPVPTASTATAATGDGGTDLYQAIDGRVWFYPEVRNYWTNQGSRSRSDWFAVDLGAPESIRAVRLYFYGDGTRFKAPPRVTLQYRSGTEWLDVRNSKSMPPRPLVNGETTISFAPVRTARLRAVFDNPAGASIALVEMKAFGDRKVRTDVPIARERADGAVGIPLRLDGLESQNSQTGVLNGVRWRDATGGGFFSFDLKTVPGASHALVVTYWGSDTGNRAFDIRIDGVKVAEQVLSNNRPGRFFDVTYPIPEALTRGKPKINVRFQAKPGAIAGGVFGARLAGR
jgi:hypothetical protein